MPEPVPFNFAPLPKQTAYPTLERRARIVARLQRQKQFAKGPAFMRTVRYWGKGRKWPKTRQESKQRVLPYCRHHPVGPLREPDRAKRAWESHLGRAKWLTENGYRRLPRGGAPH